jgi:hypothetical protein
MSELYYYDVSVVEVFLPTIISESYEMPSKIKDLGNSVKGSEVSDGMNWLVLRSDIATAYYKLPEAKQNILRLRFSMEQPDWATLAKEMDSTPDGARMKVQRACLDYALNHSVLGWWGGTSELQRKRLRRQLNIIPIPVIVERNYA